MSDAPFDETEAYQRYVAGFTPGRSSTQSWDLELWTRGWRDDDGELEPGTLGEEGGAWWFRALTDAGRLTGTSGELTADALTAVSARARIAAFMGEADQALIHWPIDALAPAAFALREAVGLNEAIAILAESLEPQQLSGFLEWLGPVDEAVAVRWIGQLTEPAAIEVLAHLGGAHREALERLQACGALPEADRLVTTTPPDAAAQWVCAANRPVHLDLLQRCVDIVDDETFLILARRCRAKRDRRYWDTIARRPVPGLVPKLLERLDGPIAPWVYRAFAAGGDATIDGLIDVAAGRSKRVSAAVAVLSELDQFDVRERLEAREAKTREKVLKRLTPRRELPELPRADWPAWLTAFAGREPSAEEWLDVGALPPLDTRSGHRLPLTLTRGVVATLQHVRLSTPDEGSDRFDAALAELRGLLDSASANSFWHALFAMWWSDHRPDVQWVVYAAAFLCDGHAIRDLGASLRRRNTWFGNISSRVVVTLGHSDTRWAVAALDDIAHRAKSIAHRELATDFLEQRATRAGVTVDRFVLDSFPDELDPILIDSASRRLERAMVEQTPWFPRATDKAPFRTNGQVAVWCATDAWGDRRFFRLDDADRIDLDGNVIELGPDDVVTVAHPAQLDDADLAAWHEHFADYELVQQFDQLARARYRHQSLSRDGFTSPVGRAIDGPPFLRAAQRRGWTPARRGAHGEIVAVERTFEHLDARARLELAEPLEEDGIGRSVIAALTFHSLHGAALDPADVDPVAFSEAHLDIARLVPNGSQQKV